MFNSTSDSEASKSAFKAGMDFSGGPPLISQAFAPDTWASVDGDDDDHHHLPAHGRPIDRDRVRVALVDHIVREAKRRKTFAVSGNPDLEVLPPWLFQDAEVMRASTVVNISRNRLVELPPQVFNFTGAQYFLAFKNHLRRIPSELGNMHSLEVLDLSCNRIEGYLDDEADLQHVQQKGGIGLGPPGLHRAIFGLTNLRVLNLDNNPLRRCSIRVGKLTNLTHLGLANTRIRVLPSQIGDCLELQHLILKDNRLKFLPDTLLRCRKLEFLALDRNKLSQLPIGWQKSWSRLRFLTLWANHLESLPSHAGMKSLRAIRMGHNRISRVCDEGLSVGTLVGEVDLADNRISVFPRWLERASDSLVQLNLSLNRIVEVPWDVFDSFSKLKRVVLSGNQIGEFPELLRVPTLEELRLSSNCIREIPVTAFDGLPELRKLFLDRNKLTAIPDSIRRLDKLYHLRLSHNRLTTLPDGIVLCKDLRQLEADHNRIEVLPDASHVRRFRKLRKLVLNHNLMRVPPVQLAKIQPLLHCDLADNPFHETYVKVDEVVEASEKESELTTAEFERKYETVGRFEERRLRIERRTLSEMIDECPPHESFSSVKLRVVSACHCQDANRDASPRPRLSQLDPLGAVLESCVFHVARSVGEPTAVDGPLHLTELPSDAFSRRGISLLVNASVVFAVRLFSVSESCARQNKHVWKMASDPKKMERTFVAIKPDAVQRGLIGRIITRYEDKGLKIVAMKMIVPSRELAEEHYAEHKGRSFFEPLLKYICSGPCVALVLQGRRIIESVRKAMEVGRNIVHASDGVESAAREIKLWFGEDLYDWNRDDEKWVYE